MVHLGLRDSMLSHFTCSSALKDPWNIVIVYDPGLVDIKALYDLPERHDLADW